jgi:hypothetical protein
MGKSFLRDTQQFRHTYKQRAWTNLRRFAILNW